MRDELNDILEKYNIHTQEDFDAQTENDDLYEELYDYWVGTGQMPYGTMKARDGDPGQWVFDATWNNLPPAVDIVS